MMGRRKGGDSLIEIIEGVTGRNLDSDSGLALRHDRVKESNRINP